MYSSPSRGFKILRWHDMAIFCTTPWMDGSLEAMYSVIASRGFTPPYDTHQDILDIPSRYE